jgi:hypothetical protein
VAFLIITFLVLLFLGWMALSRRIAELKRKVEELEIRPSDARLIARIYALEKAMEESRGERPEPAATPIYERLNLCSYCGKMLPAPPAVCECQRETSAPVGVPEPVVYEPVYAPAYTARAPRASFTERSREKMSGEEWEAIVGGSWLNKLGVFILVIGIALFLGYSFTKMGPGGRVAIGLALSLTMLGAGVVVEKRAKYTIFGRGLLGGGWGALYFTTYAMHAVESAKVIDNVLAGSLLVLAVATGMIIHSLRYRSQTVTGLAYFLGFATLSPVITTTASLTAIALVPLAASLLYVANRFQWSQLALFGLVATYGTCASQGDSGAPALAAEAVFATYWLLFESFDLLRVRRGTEYTTWERALLPLNALAFALLSYAKWSKAEPQHLYVVAGATAAAYLASGILRAVWRPPSSFAKDTSTLERVFSGGYEGPITLTAALSAAAVFLKLHGVVAEAGLLAEAEAFFLAGLYFRQAYPRRLAAALFAVCAGKLVVSDIPDGAQTAIGSWSFKAWTPAAALSALLFYLNRGLRSSDKFYGYSGSLAIAVILGFEVPSRYVGTAWTGLAALLFAFGWLRGLEDFRIQGYMGGALGFVGTALYQLSLGDAEGARGWHRWITLACSAAVSYGGVQCALRSGADRLEAWERTGVRRFGSWAATLALVALAWRLLSSEYVGLGWLAMALLLLELGLRGLPEDFRKQSYAVGLLGAVNVLFAGVIPVTNTGALGPRLAIGGSAVLAYLFFSRAYFVGVGTVTGRERSAVLNFSSGCGTFFFLAATWALLPSIAVGPAWAVAGLLLVELGFVLDLPSLRVQGHLAAAASFARLFFANFTGFGSTGFVSHRVLTVVPVIVAQYYQWSRQRAAGSQLRAWESSVGRVYLYAAALLGVVLMRFELGRVVAVTGWSAFALGLLIFGNRWNNVDLRWQSYALSALAFWRSWTTNFYAPESFAGVPGRVLTGAFVIGCFYAAHLLTPRRTDDRSIERHARLYFSMLATVLLAVLLFYEVSGSMLTVAWGVEGVALLLAGFPLSDRVFRLSGLTLFLICVLKLFLYDLRHLETLYRILSFIVLGVMLVSMSWIYTRFRDRLRRYL